MFNKALYTLFFQLCITALAFAQDLRNVEITSLTTNEGLSQGMVYSIIQDRQGFMWFATKGGLNKYDGYTFTTYQPMLQNSMLPAQGLFEDSRGYLWTFEFGRGLMRFDPRTENFRYFIHNPSDLHSISSNFLWNFFEDSRGYLWITTLDGLNLFDHYTGNFHHFSLNPKIPSTVHQTFQNSIGPPLEDEAGNIYVDSPKKSTVFALNFSRKLHAALSEKKTTPNLEQRLRNEIEIQAHPYKTIVKPDLHGRFPMLIDENRTLWIATKEALLQKDMNSEENFHFQNYQYPAQSLYRDKQRETIWLHTDKGMHGFDISKKTITHYPSANANTNLWNKHYFIPASDNHFILLGPEAKEIVMFHTTTGQYEVKPVPSFQEELEFMTFLQDKAGVIWLGTNGGGVEKLYISKKAFGYYGKNSMERTPENRVYVSDVYEDPSRNLWVLTSQQIARVDRSTGKWTRMDGHFQSSLPSGDYGQAPHFLQASNGAYWITNLNKVFRYKPGRDELTEMSFNTHNILELLEDKTGKICVFFDSNSTVEMAKFDPETQRFMHYNLPAKLSTKYTHNYPILEDQHQGFWIGLDDELHWVDIETGQSKSFRYDPIDSESVNKGVVAELCEDSKTPEKYLWVAIKGGGLNRLDKQTGKCKRYTTQNGMIDNTVYSVLFDDAGYLWMGTNKGLTRFHPPTETFRHFTYEDGLQGNEFNTGAAFKSPSGELFFGGTHGLTAFFPEEIKDNPHLPNVAITGFKIVNQPISHKDSSSVLSQVVNYTEHITLRHDQNMIGFEFAALDYANPAKNQYSYKLEGLEETWSPARTVREATYTNLDPGSYTFLVKGSNNDGIWNEQPARIGITIRPPWWATGWAYTLYAISTLMILALIVRFQRKRVQLKNQLALEHREAEQLKVLDKIKTRFFSNITHEFRTPLSLIMGPAEEALKQKNLNQDAHQKFSLIKRNSQKLLRLINQLLDLSKLEGKRMDVEQYRGDLTLFTSRMVENFQSIAKKKHIRLNFESRMPVTDYLFDRDKIEKINYNLLSNALKFTPEKGRISFTITPQESAENEPQGVTITVEDTGMGIAPEDLTHIFDRFYQVDTSSTRKHEGTGIGLALTKELTELMGGSIKADSEVGKGAQFTVFLPVLPAPETASEAVEEQADPGTLAMHPMEEDSPVEAEMQQTIDLESEKPIIQIVEDNADLRQFVKTALSSTYQVLTARDGAEGIAQALEHVPDLVISDIMMPEKDGFEVCEALRQNSLTSHIPIILLTAKAALESRLHGFRTGADAYLSKPFSMEELQLRINKLIEQRKLLQQKYIGAIDVKETDDHPRYSALDQRFLDQLHTFIEKELSNEELDVETLARETGISHRQLYRKVKALTNLSIAAFIRDYRLQRAMQLLQEGDNNVSEVSYLTGFSSRSYFHKAFTEKYGMPPSKVKKS